MDNIDSGVRDSHVEAERLELPCTLTKPTDFAGIPCKEAV